MKKFSGVLALGMTAAIWSLAGNAVAQWGAADHGGCGPGMGRERMGQIYERHKTELHDRLKLTAEQEKAWKAFVAKADALRPQGQPDPKELAGLNAPQRVQKMLDHMREHEQSMSGMLTAMNEFYAVLTPQQQKTFDDSQPGQDARGMHGSKSGKASPEEQLN